MVYVRDWDEFVRRAEELGAQGPEKVMEIKTDLKEFFFPDVSKRLLSDMTL